MPSSTMLRAMFLEWAHDKAMANPGTSVSAQEFMDANDIDLDLMFNIVQSCADQGWVEDVSTFGGPAVIMTFEGIAEVEAQRKRRNDAGGRAAAARNGLLWYFHRKELEGVHMPAKAEFVFADESFFEGVQFSVTEIDRAAAYLSAKGLIKGVPVAEEQGPVRAQVTPEGQDCIDQFDGDVLRYLSRNEGVTPAVHTTHIGTFNNSGAAAIGSTNVTQHVTSGADVAALAKFARVLLAEFEKLSLGEDLKTEVRAALEEIEAEAKAETAPGRLQAALGRFAGFVVSAGKPVLTAAFMVLATHLGLPPAH